MGYYIDLENIGLDEYAEMLKSIQLVPSRMLLLDDVDAKFDLLEQMGMKNVLELQKALNTKSGLLAFSNSSGLNVAYLKVLVREINSNCPKPIKLSFFEQASSTDIEKLNSFGIINTLQLFPFVLLPSARQTLSKKISIELSIITKLSQFSDLVRIRWVNHTFAKILYLLGYNSAAKVADADYKTLYFEIKDLNNREKFYKNNIGEKDIKLCVEAAKLVPNDMVF